jgi:putative heme-binding domain-containing protein
MPSISRAHRVVVISLLLWAGAFVPASRAQQEDSVEADFKAGPAPGERAFASTCAGYHGLDGRGSDKAPNIAANAKVQHLTNVQISSIISGGVPGTGMPAFRSLSPAQVHALVGYLRVLQGKVKSRAVSGDAIQGKKIFFGKGDCSTCHMISGEGGFLGPDLSAYGSTASADAILKSLLNSTRTIQPGFKPATITRRDGSRVEGVVRNEDNFSLQLQMKDGSFFFFEKTDLQRVDYGSQSLMPANYGERLNAGELNDLISFLIGTGSPSKATRTSKPQ